MPGTQLTLGPFVKGLHNSAGTGEYIDDQELFDLVNLEVDTDGSLANRPAISSIAPSGVSGRVRIIGTFISRNGNNYLVLSYGTSFGTTGLFNVAANSITVSRSIKSNIAVQYSDNIYVVPASDGTAGTGGYWDSSATPVWTAVASMPRGDDATMYVERLCVTAGINSTTNTSRLYRSSFQRPDVWFGDTPPVSGLQAGINDAGNVDFEQGNGQKLVSVLVMNQDLVVFKEHSTFRYVLSGDPSKAQILKISSTIGTPNIRCAVTYDTNNIYLLHDTSVYELYNYTFTKLSSGIAMQQISDTDVFSDANYGLTLFRNRLFVRYYRQIYVYSLMIGRWSRWITDNKFSYVTVIPNSSGRDVAYAASVSQARTNFIFSFVDDRIMKVGIDEIFQCWIITKTYDFQLSWAYKVLFWWGMTIATSGSTTATVDIPNTQGNLSWVAMANQYGSWANVKANNIKWENSVLLLFSTTTLSELGSYARKFLKFNKKIRFRQAWFTVSTTAVTNSVGDASVRIYDLSVFINQKQTVVRRTT